MKLMLKPGSIVARRLTTRRVAIKPPTKNPLDNIQLKPFTPCAELKDMGWTDAQRTDPNRKLLKPRAA